MCTKSNIGANFELLENTHEDTWEALPRCSSCHPPNTRLSSARQGLGSNQSHTGSSPGFWQCTCLHESCRCPQPGGFHMRQLQGDTQRNIADPLFRFDLWLFCAKGAQLKKECGQLICNCCTVYADSSQSLKPNLKTAKLPETMLFGVYKSNIHPPGTNN